MNEVPYVCSADYTTNKRFKAFENNLNFIFAELTLFFSIDKLLIKRREKQAHSRCD